MVGLCKRASLATTAHSKVLSLVERHTRCCNAQWTFDGLQFVCIHETGMGNVSGVDLAGLQVPHDVLGAEAITDASDGLDTLLSQLLYRCFYDGIDTFIAVARPPLHEVEVGWAVQLKGVAVEEIGHDDVVAVGGELVRNELGIDELVTDDIGQDEHGVGNGLVLWIRNVCLGFNAGMSVALVSCLSNVRA